ncbi:sugar phosphate isomerase/epimerase family protein [Marinactinospora thermotolerans]|uniref:Sugar phosphate isomerase/epimerase n=1 Tax=Marinactinospora thermotolerans DSM 45154 TaxID=1122192 RepID=A0A1T4SNV5_9ACTN|nr:sugar phosphate isomerase/epimerase [Marinactinospora thermotolerans]SKA29837.1 Sugar phosphate isomerase/epimerase [Marinactinospora thermotolerans DSM 45154]
MAGIDRSEFKRRGFLRALAASTVAVSAGALSTATAAPAHAANGRLIPPGKIGIQLYSIRDKVERLGFRVVFEELARIGYKEVEFAGYSQPGVGPITVPEIRRLLDDNGLKAVGTHVGLSAWRNGLERELDNAEILGLKYVGTANAPTSVNTVAGYQAAAEEFNRFGEAAAARGIKFYQHNHAGEFAFAQDRPDVRLYDVFLDNTDPDLVFLELDIYWAFAGQHRYPGFDPVDYVNAHPRRYPLFHVKDGKSNPANDNGYDIIEFGAGDLPYRRFFSSLRSRGAHHGIWEQDNAASTAAPPHPVDSFGNAERSYDAMYRLRG